MLAMRDPAIFSQKHLDIRSPLRPRVPVIMPRLVITLRRSVMPQGAQVSCAPFSAITCITL